MVEITRSDLTRRGSKANPWPLYARLRSEAPVCRVSFLIWPFWIVMRYDDVYWLLRDDRFSKNWKEITPELLHRLLRPIARNILSLDPPDHTRLRALVNKAFTPRLVEEQRSRIERVCDDLLDGVARSGRMDLVQEYALPIPLTIIAEMLGIPPQDRPQFRAWTKKMIEGFFSVRVALMLPAMWKFIRYLHGVFAERRGHPRDDLITALVQAEEAGDKLREDELIAMVILLLIAGYETTVHLIAGSALALLENPEQRELLLQNPALAEPAVEELLRYTSPLDFATPRSAREDVKIGSTTIPRGAVVLAGLASANRDESAFPNPNRLDLTREPNRHMAFGQGIHFCLGAPLARLEGQIAIPTLFRRLPNLHLAVAPESLRWRKNIFLRALEELPVAF